MKDLIKKAKEYLKEQFDENCSMFDIKKNSVKNGAGILEADCEVDGIYAGKWHKKFHFKDGKIVDMDATRA